MPTFVCQTDRAFANGAMQSLDICGVENRASMRTSTRLLGSLQTSMGHRGRVLATTCMCLVPVMTVPMCMSGHTCTQALPGPGMTLTFSRKARCMLPGDANQPSVTTRSRRTPVAARRMCWSHALAYLLSRLKLTVLATRRRVDTITANPMQAIIGRPFARISSACTCPRSRWLCSIRTSWTRWPCFPARFRPSAVVRSSQMHARPITWTGHPYERTVMTIRTRFCLEHSSSLFARCLLPDRASRATPLFLMNRHCLFSCVPPC